MTIYEAAIKALQILGKPSSLDEIYQVIINNEMYEFGAKNPLSVLSVELLRRCEGANISKPAKVKVFYKESPGIFGLLNWDPSEIENDEINEINDMSKLLKLIEEKEGTINNDPKEQKRLVRGRDAAIKRYARLRAKGICEACGMAAPFIDIKGNPFLEVHHLQQLSEEGLDHPKNVAAICPNCHRKVHYGISGLEYNELLKKYIEQKEK